MPLELIKDFKEFLGEKARHSLGLSRRNAGTPSLKKYYEEESEQFEEIARLVELMIIPKGDRLSFLGDAIDHWSVKDVGDRINLMSGDQARNALHAIRGGAILKAAIKIGYSTNPTN